MKTIIIGYGDVEGKGPSKQILGSDVSPVEQMRFIAEIKASGKYPDGIVRVQPFSDLGAGNIAVCTKADAKARAEDAAAREKRDKANSKNRPAPAASKPPEVPKPSPKPTAKT